MLSAGTACGGVSAAAGGGAAAGALSRFFGASAAGGDAGAWRGTAMVSCCSGMGALGITILVSTSMTVSLSALPPPEPPHEAHTARGNIAMAIVLIAYTQIFQAQK